MNTLEARRRLLGRNVYKRKTEGNPAIAQGSLARRYPGITMQGWTEQAQYEGNQLLPLSVGKVIESESGNNTLTVTESGVNLNFTESAIVSYTNDIYVFGNSQYNIEAGYEDASAYIPQGIYTLITDIVSSNVEVFISVWRDGVKLDLVQGAAQKPANFTLLEGDKIRIGLRPKNTLDISNATLMVIKQTLPSTTPYEPYTGGVPSPSPDYKQDVKNAGKYNEETQKYEYQVKLTGANLFDPDGEIVNGSPYAGIPLDNKGIISMSLYEKNPDVDLSNIYFGICSEELNSKNVGWAIANGAIQAGGKIITPGTNRYVCWYPRNETVLQKVLSRYGVMVNYGGGVYLPYQPYKNQTVTLTSDRPLTKWDKLEKRNGQWGWVYKSAEKILDGTENYVAGSGSYVSDFSSNCYIDISNMVIDGRTNAFMNRLSNIDYSWTQPDAIGFSKNRNQLHVRISNSDLGTTGESSGSEITNAMKAYMAQQYEDGNPFIFWYETAEETFVPLSETEQEAMNALHTFRPTTVLSNDAGCNMSLTYKTKKSLEVTT